MSWRPTKYADLHRIKLPEDPSDADVRGMLDDTDETGDFLHENSRTWDESGLILAIVGVSPLWKGVGTVWTLLTSDARQRGVGISRGVLRFIHMLHVERSYRRLQATIEHGDETARLWIVRLGFRYEGTMVAYAPDGKTHDMYARLRF